MRVLLSLALAALLVFALAPAAAMRSAASRRPYQRDCRDIRIDGNMLSTFCRGSQGSGQSSLNVLSCASRSMSTPRAALICRGPGAGRPPPAAAAIPRRDRPRRRRILSGPGGGGGRSGGRWSATLYEPPATADAPSPSMATRRTSTAAA